MAKKKLSKLEKLDQIIDNADYSKWCVVDAENNFYFMDAKMTIDPSVSQYTVLNKPKVSEKGTMNNWSNDAQMCSILVVDDGDDLRFFDENFEEINQSKVEFS